MAGITNAIEDLISSILGIFHSLFNTVFASLEGVGAVFATFVSSVFDLGSALIGFILSNIVVIGILAAAFVGYTAYLNRQGKTVTTTKKKA